MPPSLPPSLPPSQLVIQYETSCMHIITCVKRENWKTYSVGDGLIQISTQLYYDYDYGAACTLAPACITKLVLRG